MVPALFSPCLPAGLHELLDACIQEVTKNAKNSAGVAIVLFAASFLMPRVTCDPNVGTRDGELPPWEVTKAGAFHNFLGDVA